VPDRGDGRVDVAFERSGEAFERPLAGSEASHVEARQALGRSHEPRDQARADQRRLAGAGGADDEDLALAAAQPVHDVVELGLATEETVGINLGERPHAGIRASQVRLRDRGPIEIRAEPIDLGIP
jgi:hypothetical protein